MRKMNDLLLFNKKTARCAASCLLCIHRGRSVSGQTKGRSMRQDICANPNCKSVFTPGKRHPNQQYCSRAECRRYAGSLRGRRYYARHCSDKAWHRLMLDRKREERRRRGCAASPDGGRCGGAAGAVAYPDAVIIFQLLVGMTAMITGSRDASEVRSAMSRCLELGREFFNAENIQTSSSHELFLTLVREENDADPNAGPFSNPFRC